MQGWYPDPAGAPGRFRYWDGTTWSTVDHDQPGRSATARTPSAGSPAAPTAATRVADRRNSRRSSGRRRPGAGRRAAARQHPERCSGAGPDRLRR